MPTYFEFAKKNRDKVLAKIKTKGKTKFEINKEAAKKLGELYWKEKLGTKFRKHPDFLAAQDRKKKVAASKARRREEKKEKKESAKRGTSAYGAFKSKMWKKLSKGKKIRPTSTEGIKLNKKISAEWSIHKNVVDAPKKSRRKKKKSSVTMSASETAPASFEIDPFQAEMDSYFQHNSHHAPMTYEMNSNDEMTSSSSDDEY